jgi:hypothetical protein
MLEAISLLVIEYTPRKFVTYSRSSHVAMMQDMARVDAANILVQDSQTYFLHSIMLNKDQSDIL